MTDSPYRTPPEKSETKWRIVEYVYCDQLYYRIEYLWEFTVTRGFLWWRHEEPSAIWMKCDDDFRSLQAAKDELPNARKRIERAHRGEVVAYEEP
jgi:hypothetical protein